MRSIIITALFALTATATTAFANPAARKCTKPANAKIAEACAVADALDPARIRAELEAKREAARAQAEAVAKAAFDALGDEGRQVWTASNP